MAFTRILESDRVKADRVNQLGDDIIEYENLTKAPKNDAEFTGVLKLNSVDISSAIGQNTSDLNAHKAENVSQAMIVQRDPTLANGVQAVSTSFKPKSIIIFGHLDNMDCRGFWAENNVQRVSAKDAATGNYTGQGDAILFKNGTNNIKGTIQNVTDTGFEISWIKTGTVSGVVIALNILVLGH